MPIELDPDAEERNTNRFLENVLPVPDFNLQIPDDDPDDGEDNSYTVEAGTYVRLGKALEAWGSPPAGVRPIGVDDLRFGVMPYVDMASGLIPGSVANPDLWAVRISTVLEHYRRTFELPWGWADNSLSIKAIRSTTIDKKLGTRAPSPVWADYAYVRNQPALLDQGQGDITTITYAINVFGYPKEGAVLSGSEKWGFRAIDANSKNLARAEMIDSDLGIFRIEFLRTPGMHFAQALPGTIIDAKNVKVDVRKIGINTAAASVFFNGAVSGQPLPKLNGDWKMATILTLVPAGPNNESQLFPLEIAAQNEELAEALPGFVVGGQAQARGPVMDVRIPASVETARGIWKDTHAGVISEMFGVTGDWSDPEEGLDVSDLITNLRRRPVNANRGAHLFNELEAIAVAEAARIYTEFSNRIEGNKSADAVDQTVTLSGNMDSIQMSIAPNGEATVSMSMPTEGPKISMFAFLDAGTRRLILRLVR